MTGVQTCALPILNHVVRASFDGPSRIPPPSLFIVFFLGASPFAFLLSLASPPASTCTGLVADAGCRPSCQQRPWARTPTCTLRVAWASSPSGGRVPTQGECPQRGLDGSCVTFSNPVSEVTQCCFWCVLFIRSKFLKPAHIQRKET